MYFKDLNIDLRKTENLLYTLKFLAFIRMCKYDHDKICKDCDYYDICSCWDSGTVLDSIYSAAIKFVENHSQERKKYWENIPEAKVGIER